jgi:hypothetical protein
MTDDHPEGLALTTARTPPHIAMPDRGTYHRDNQAHGVDSGSLCRPPQTYVDLGCDTRRWGVSRAYASAARAAFIPQAPCTLPPGCAEADAR